MSNHLTVLFFATLKDRAGGRQASIDLAAGATVRDLRAALGRQFPALTPLLPSALVAVNRQYAFDDDVLPPQAEVALFPPVSGG